MSEPAPHAVVQDTPTVPLPGAPTPADPKMANAIAFLRHPKVITASLQQKASFLHSKGLSQAEIIAAFRSIDPNSSDAISLEIGTMNLTPPPPPVPTASPALPASSLESPSRLPFVMAIGAALAASVGGAALWIKHYSPDLWAQLFPSTGSNVEGIPPPPPPPAEVKADESAVYRELLDRIDLLGEQANDTAHRMSYQFDSIARSIQRLEQRTTSKLLERSDHPSAANLVTDPPPSMEKRPTELSPAVRALLEEHRIDTPPVPIVINPLVPTAESSGPQLGTTRGDEVEGEHDAAIQSQQDQL